MSKNIGVKIRPLSESDIDAYQQIRLRALKENPESFGEAVQEHLDTSLAEIARRLKNADESFVFGAFNPDLVGTVGFYRQPGIKARHKGMIVGMYVAPEARTLGLGRALMEAVIARASTIPDLKQLMLTVVTANEVARKLYLSFGFTSYGIEPAALKIDNQYFDEELMILKFTN